MKINLTTPINKLSYGYVGVNILRELLKAGHEVSLFPIGGNCETEKYYEQYVVQGLNNAKKFDLLAQNIIVWHSFGLQEFSNRFRGKTYGFPIFELDKFSQKDAEGVNSVSELFVTSQWAKNIAKRYSSKPINVINLGVDTEVFKHELQKYHEPYVNYFTSGKWEVRKGHDFVCKTFKKAFGDKCKNSAKLNILANNPFLSEKENNSWENLFMENLGDSVNIIKNRLTSQTDCVKIMQDMDIGFFPSRAEGWNFPLCETLAMKKPCITTNFSAHTEFCNKENCYLIDVDETEPAFDGEFFFGQGEWAKFGPKQEEQTIELLRQSFEDIFENKPKKSEFKFTWENSANQIIKHLNG